MMQQTLLIVDDESIWLKLLGRLFSKQGYEILFAQSCAAAIEIARTHRLDCVVLDFNLGDGDASLVGVAIKGLAKEKTPILLFSSDPDAVERLGGEWKPDRFLIKPGPVFDLLAAVQELMAEGKGKV